MRPSLDLALTEILPALGIDPQQVCAAETLLEGLSGARLWRVLLAIPAGDWVGAPRWHGSRIIKAQAAGVGWLANVTHDTHIREAALWQTGFAGRLPRQIGLAVERVTPPLPTPISPPNSLSYEERGNQTRDAVASPTYLPLAGDAPAVAPNEAARLPATALLMRDVRSRLMRRPYRTPPGHLPPLIAATLDALAALHARFWQSPELDDSRLGLAVLRDTLLWLTPDAITAARAAGVNEPYLDLAERGWQAFFHWAAPEDTVILRATLDNPEPTLAAIARLPHTLIHGDVWGPNLGRLPRARSLRGPGSRVLLIDWALTAAAPSTWDLLGLFGAWHTLDPVTVFAAYRARLTRRLHARGMALAPATWRLLSAAAYLRGALTLGEAYGRAVADAPGSVAQRQAIARLRWWARRGARAADALQKKKAPCMSKAQ